MQRTAPPRLALPTLLVLLALLVLAASLAGCSGAAGGAAPPDPTGPAQGAPTDEQLAQLTVKLRGRAGVFYDANEGKIYITLYEADSRPDAERAVAEVLGPAAGSVVIRNARYSEEQLQHWYRQLNKQIGPAGGITVMFVDTRRNQLHYGVTTTEAKERLEAVIRKTGVPRDAVYVDLPEGALSEAAPLQGCLLAEPPPAGEEPASPYRLSISSEALRPGQAFTLRVAGAEEGELTRGVDAYLECWDGEGWSPRYTLFSDADQPTAVIYSPNRVINAIGFDAARPGNFVLPHDLEPGWYRIRLGASGRVNGSLESHELWAPVEVKP